MNIDYTGDQQKAAFMLLTLDEKLGMLFDMQRYVRGEISGLKKEQLEFEEELREVRRRREARENVRQEDLETTTQKFKAMMEAAEEKRFDFWIYLRDKVLPQVLTVIIFAVLYLSFGAKP